MMLTFNCVVLTNLWVSGKPRCLLKPIKHTGTDPVGETFTELCGTDLDHHTHSINLR